jgi:hypothetical protein
MGQNIDWGLGGELGVKYYKWLPKYKIGMNNPIQRSPTRNTHLFFCTRFVTEIQARRFQLPLELWWGVVGSSVSAYIYMVPAKIKTRRTSPIQNRAFLQFRGAYRRTCKLWPDKYFNTFLSVSPCFIGYEWNNGVVTNMLPVQIKIQGENSY